MKEESAKTVKKLEEFMLVDPMPAERIELIKCEIKQEIQVDIRNMSPMRRRGSDPPSKEDL